MILKLAGEHVYHLALALHLAGDAPAAEGADEHWHWHAPALLSADRRRDRSAGT